MAGPSRNNKCTSSTTLCRIANHNKKNNNILLSYLDDTPPPVLAIIGPQDLKVDVGVGSVVSKLQEAGQTPHSRLYGKDTKSECCQNGQST